jgi:hypothetical protein
MDMALDILILFLRHTVRTQIKPHEDERQSVLSRGAMMKQEGSDEINAVSQTHEQDRGYLAKKRTGGGWEGKLKVFSQHCCFSMCSCTRVTKKVRPVERDFIDEASIFKSYVIGNLEQLYGTPTLMCRNTPTMM